MDIDHSKVSTWKQCRQKYYFQYELKVEPKKPQLDLLLGSAIHYALERLYGYGDEAVSAFVGEFNRLYENATQEYTLTAEECDALIEFERLGVSMLEHYLTTWRSPEHIAQDFTYVVSEYSFRVPIPHTQGYFEGRVDGIIVDPYGEYWVVEHKTATTFPSPEYFALDEQSLKYQWAMQQVIREGGIAAIPRDTVLAGWCYNGLRKSIPRRPPVLKNGKALSVARIDSTYDVYLDTILEHGFSPDDYTDMLEQLRLQGNTFFNRGWYRRTRQELRMIEYRLLMEHDDMENGKFVYPSPSKLCPNCPYYEPCWTTQKGGDVSFILRHMFRPKTRRSTEGGDILVSEDRV